MGALSIPSRDSHRRARCRETGTAGSGRETVQSKRTSQLAPRCTVHLDRDGAGPSSWSRSKPSPRPTWPSSTGCSAPGSRPPITAGPTPKRARPLSSACSPAAPRCYPPPPQLHEAFLWSEARTVTKTATVSLHGNTFEVDAALVGSRVEVVFDPFDMGTVEVRFQGRSMGQGVPVIIGRHSHPQARPEAAPAPAPTGIDYLGLLAKRRDAELARSINYAQLSCPGPRRPRTTAATTTLSTKTRRPPYDHRPPPGALGLHRVCPSPKTWPPPCCYLTAPTPRPSPGSPGASTRR